LAKWASRGLELVEEVGGSAWEVEIVKSWAGGSAMVA
jgi:hypothetical protein